MKDRFAGQPSDVAQDEASERHGSDEQGRAVPSTSSPTARRFLSRTSGKKYSAGLQQLISKWERQIKSGEKAVAPLGQPVTRLRFGITSRGLAAAEIGSLKSIVRTSNYPWHHPHDVCPSITAMLCNTSRNTPCLRHDKMDGTQLFMSAGGDSTAHFLTLRETAAAQVAGKARQSFQNWVRKELVSATIENLVGHKYWHRWIS